MIPRLESGFCQNGLYICQRYAWPKSVERRFVNDLFLAEHDDGDLFQHFEVLGISADHGTTVTGIMEDMVLLSWLIVLLRTSEGNQASYDWAYKGRDGFEQGPMARHLSTGEVMTGLQSTVRQVAAAISSHITATAPSQRGNILRPVTLVLSTGFLSKASAEAKDEVSRPSVYQLVKADQMDTESASPRNTP